MARGFGATFGSGSTDGISLACSAPSTGNQTYHIWVYLNGTGGSGLGRLFHRGTPESPVYCWYDGSLMNTVIGGDSAGKNYTFPPPSTGAWASITFTASGSDTIAAYVNGVSQTVTFVAGTAAAVATTSAFMVGNRASDSARNLDGQLAEFAFWSRQLNAFEIDFLADGGSPDSIPGSLELYAPLVRDVVNLKDNTSPTVTGTAVQPHPRIYSSDVASSIRKTSSIAPAAIVAKIMQVNQARIRAAFW